MSPVIHWPRVLLAALGFLLPFAASAQAAQAASRIHVFDVDLVPLIDQSAQYPTRFAVDVGHPVSISDQGLWTDNGGTSTWTYTGSVATAVSMSFHASRLSLPPSAVLSVRGSHSVATYRSKDVVHGGLWARPLVGDAITLSLTVSAKERSQVRLEIASFQAGYRGLGGGVPDHPHYRLLHTSDATTSSCTQNYSCQSTASNQGAANATVAIVVGNTVQCTGTLLNDTKTDGSAYVLTARHCENGMLGGGEPDAADSVTVYWDAVTPCGATLASIYDGNAVTQSGATTLVEQQDAWLLQLYAPPIASDAYYAGWDATGGTFSGGYSVHHALGYDKQYAGWYGQALLQSIPGATLKIGYTSNFWGVVNQTGNIGAGASGGGLFDPNNRLVGSSTLGALVNGENSAGVCPTNPVAAPAATTITAQYTALSAIWSSTADTTSTKSATLQSVLDPANTGKLVTDGTGILPVTLTLDQNGTLSTGQTLTLIWNAPGAQSCTASGGLSGDGWAGTRGASGSFQLTEQDGGDAVYSLQCSATGRIGTAAPGRISWMYVPLVVNLNGPTTQVPAGGTFHLDWYGGAGCTASGGSPGDGWAGPKPAAGPQTLTASALGTFTYTLTCGTGGRTNSAQVTVTVVAPSISTISGDANQLRIGQPVNLQWVNGGNCVASGGSSADGWAGTVFSSQDGVNGISRTVSATTAGTYVYTVTCTGAGLSSESSLTLTFTNAAPSVTLSPTPASPQVYTDSDSTTASANLNLNFTANVRPCAIDYTGPGNIKGSVYVSNTSFPGSALDSQGVAGAYLYTVTCGTGANQAKATASVTYFTNHPAVTLNLSNPWPQGYGTPIAWSSNVFPCTGTGGSGGDGWVSAKAGPAGSQTLTESQLGSLAFGITCGSGSQVATAQATTTVITPTASITASATTLPINSVLAIQWTSNFDGCTSLITPPGTQGWGTVLRGTGGFQTTEPVQGTYTYTVICEGAQASTQVTFTGTAQTATLVANSSSSPVNGSVTLSWTSMSGSSCSASGGSGTDGWSGSLQSFGSMNVTSAAATTVAYSVTCSYPQGQGQTQAQTQVTYTPVTSTTTSAPTPGVTLNANSSTQIVGDQITLTWNSTNSSQCEATGGNSGDGWEGNLPLSGAMAVTETSTGSFTYQVTCSGAPPAATAQTVVKFSASSGDAQNTGSGSGGGGALDSLLLLALSCLGIGRLGRTVPTRSQLPHT